MNRKNFIVHPREEVGKQNASARTSLARQIEHKDLLNPPKVGLEDIVTKKLESGRILANCAHNRSKNARNNDCNVSEYMRDRTDRENHSSATRSPKLWTQSRTGAYRELASSAALHCRLSRSGTTMTLCPRLLLAGARQTTLLSFLTAHVPGNTRCSTWRHHATRTTQNSRAGSRCTA